jgi:uncharacterized protein YqgC (DUF456 family)
MMTLIDMLFWFSSLYILPFWLMMWFAPEHERTKQMMSNEWLFLAPLLIAYTVAVIPSLPSILLAFSSEMPTPALVINMFSEDEVILIGWLHFLAFDLLAGRWTWERLMEAKQPIFVSMPVLFLSMMVAPLGCLLGMFVTRIAITTTE